jgi:hypothetical protein
MVRRVIVKSKPSPIDTAEVAARIAAEANADEDGEEDDEEEDEDDEEIEDLVDEARDNPALLPKPTKAPLEEDIFEFAEKNYVSRGIPISYLVKKNGSFVGELPHPCSWGFIQEVHGGGLFFVRARNLHSKTFIKTQSMHILETAPKPIQHKVEREETMEPKVIERIVEKEVSREPQINFFELMNLMKSNQNDAQSQIREAQKEAQNAQQTLMAAMLQMATAKPQGSSDDKMMALMMQMQQNTNQMFEKMMQITKESISEINKSSEKMFDKINTRIEAISSQQAPTKDMAYTPQQIMEIMMSSQTKGFEMWSHMEKMADMKAQQRLSILEATKENAVEESRPKSLTEKLVDTMLPAVATAIQAQAMQQTQVQQIPPRQLPPLRTAPRPQIAPPQAARPMTQVAPRVQKQVRVTPAPVVAQEPKKTPVVQAEFVSEVKRDPFGLPTAKPVEDVFDEQKFAQYMQIAADVLTPCITAQKPIPETSLVLIDSLQAQGIEVKDFLESCPVVRVNETLKMFGADETMLSVIGEVYANLEARTAMGVGG